MIKPIKRNVVFYDNCDGECSIEGGCSGNIYPIKVGRPETDYWKEFNYCETAIATDTRNGFVVKRQRKSKKN